MLEKAEPLKDVLYVPELNCNLLCGAKLFRDLKCMMSFFNDSCVLRDCTSRTLIGMDEQRDGIYYCLGAPKMKNQVNAVGTRHLWHHHFGHPSHEVISGFFKKLGLCGGNKDVCDVCFGAKQSRSRFTISDNKASDLFELIHCDISGPYRVKASCGAIYFLTIGDDASRATWVYLTKEESEVAKSLKGSVAMAHNQFGKGVKIIKSDNGLEFKSGPVKEFYLSNGIIHQTSCVETPNKMVGWNTSIDTFLM